jgi:hypothetical protein
MRSYLEEMKAAERQAKTKGAERVTKGRSATVRGERGVASNRQSDRGRHH